MIIFVYFLSFLIFFWFPNISYASPFFSSAEEREITSIIREARKNDPIQKADRLMLQAIVWSNSSEWTLWINGEKWTSDQKNKRIQVLDVAPQYVDLLIEAPDKSQKNIRLHVHQTYCFSTEEISEGE